MGTFNWGIIGPGGIAHRFATALTVIPDAKLVSVGGRNMDKVHAFADQYHVKNRYNSYLEVAQDPAVDGIYVATTHPYHLENVLLCLENKKAVLCEKPFTLNDAEAKIAFDAAKKNDTFIMEAMWTQLLPIYDVIEEWIKDDLIGKIGIVQANFGFCPDNSDVTDRHIAPEQAGGALLDLGVYDIGVAMRFLGTKPQVVKSLWNAGTTSVDFKNAFLLGYADGAVALLSSAFDTITPSDAVLCGSKGYIRIVDFVSSQKAILYVEGADPITVEKPHLKNGYEYEIMEAMKGVREHRLQSDRLSWDWTLSSMKIMTDLRREWGVIYPQEM